MQNGLTCRCNSTTKHTALSSGSVPADVFLTTYVANWTTALNANLPDVAFACTCVPTAYDARAEHYILSANQTASGVAPAAECLGEEIMHVMCAGLKDLALFECDTIWRDGVAGTTAENLLRNDAILAAARKLCAAEGGKCARTIEFQDVPDEQLQAGF